MHHFTQHVCGRDVRRQIKDVTNSVDDCATTRLVECLFKRDLISPQDVLDILRPRGEFFLTDDEGNYLMGDE